MDSFLKKECDLKFFHENGFVRKKCSSCRDYFWTLDKDAKLCGDHPCVKFSFIGKPLGKKPFSIAEVRESFLSFFEKNNHTRLKYPETGERCPVVARWRSDIYLTIASIADFQPHVTSGEVPAPANPLVISQPCIRLNDLDEVGVSGRHLTIFEMMGHHAFNKNVDEIYFKEDTVGLCDEYFVNHIGIPREMIDYKEQLWDGGGNAGPCLEVLAGGLEIATLVFMNMKEDENGEFTIKDKKYTNNPLNIVDTGYGLERIAWCTQGTETIYETVFPEMVKWLKENTKNNSDMVSIYLLADHSKCLAFMIGDGVVPSNVKAGYLARLIIRRSLRFIKKLDLKISLKDLVFMQLEFLGKEFPSLKKRKKQIGEILDIETERYVDTLSKGKSLVKRIIKEKETIDKNGLIRLYDTHGMQPEIVKNIAKEEGINVIIPDNFDSMIAELHSHEKKEELKEKIRENLPKTDRLYYKDHYTKEFDAKVIWAKGSEAILDQTAFYPDGGGQPGDIGCLIYNGKKIVVKETKKVGNAIIHVIDGSLKVGDKVHGKLDWDHRYILMKHHTGTHLVNGALRHLFGEHIWQAGSQLGVNAARFDFAHYKSISEKERKKVEDLANKFIKQAVRVEKKLMDRNRAEHKYGFRLYQGGVPPGDSIRVLNIPSIDVEACGGTHLNNTSEVGKIKIINNFERIQDGVYRVVFAAGERADDYQKKINSKLKRTKKTVSSPNKINRNLKIIYNMPNIPRALDTFKQLQEASKVFSVQMDQMDKTISRFRKLQAEVLSKQLKDAINSSKQLTKAMQHSNMVQQATLEMTKLSSEQFKQLAKTITSFRHLQNIAKNSTEQLKLLNRTTGNANKIREEFKKINDVTKQFLDETKVPRVVKLDVANLTEACTDLFNDGKNAQKMRKRASRDQIQELIRNAKTVKGTEIKIVTGKSLSDATATAGAIVKDDNYIVHIYDGNKLVSMASENVDIDLRKIAPEIGKILGGSGGGKPKMTQCGGPNKDKVNEALAKAKELTIKKLKK